MKFYQQAELVHSRWAMLGAAGVLVPDLLSKIGLNTAPPATPNWVEAQTFEYFAPPTVIALINLWLVSWVEHKRGQDMANPGSQAEDPLFKGNSLPAGEVGYPGGIFDPMNMAKGGNLAELKLKEIKNGRLAMMVRVVPAPAAILSTVCSPYPVISPGLPRLLRPGGGDWQPQPAGQPGRAPGQPVEQHCAEQLPGPVCVAVG